MHRTRANWPKDSSPSEWKHVLHVMFYLFWRVYIYGNVSVLQVLCVDREINRLDEVYQQLSSELHGATHIRSPPEKKEPRFDKPLQVTASLTHLMETPIQPPLFLQKGQMNLHCKMYFSPLLSVSDAPHACRSRRWCWSCRSVRWIRDWRRWDTDFLNWAWVLMKTDRLTAKSWLRKPARRPANANQRAEEQRNRHLLQDSPATRRSRASIRTKMRKKGWLHEFENSDFSKNNQFLVFTLCFILTDVTCYNHFIPS